MKSREFCKPITLTSEDREKLRHWPRTEIMFNCQGDLYTFTDGKLTGISRKHAQKLIEKKPLT